MARPLDKETKTRIKLYIQDRHLLDSTGETVKEAIKRDIGLDLSIVTALNLRNKAKEEVQGVVSGKVAEIQNDVMDQIRYLEPSKYIGMLDVTIKDIYARLHEPLYDGDMPAPTDIGERLRYVETMVSMIHKIMAILGPPHLKPPDLDPMGKKYGKDLFDHIEELEEVYRGQYSESIMPDAVKEQLAAQGVQL